MFVCIPTDGGKSLCYSILPRVFNLREKESSMVIFVGLFFIFAFNLDTFCKFLEQAITRAKRSVAILQLGLPTQPRNSKCLCLLGYAKSYALLLSTYHTVIVRHGSSDVAQLL